MAAKLKIGLLTDNYPHSGGFGGIGTYTRTMAEELSRQGHELHVFTGAAVERHEHKVVNGVQIWECPDWTKRRQMPLPNALEFTLRHKADSYSLVRYTMAVAVRKAIRTGPFDVLESPEFGALGDFASDRKHTKRLAVRLHGPANQYRPPSSTETWNAIDEAEKQLTLRADVVTVGTAAARDRYAEFYGCNLDHSIVIGYPIPYREANAHWPGTKACKAIFFGRLEGRKGVDVLAAAIGMVRRRFPEFTLAFNGKDVIWEDGQQGSDKIRDIAEQTGGAGAFTISPPLTDAQLVHDAQHATLCVFPSRAEAFGIVLLEGMMWGTPIVASDIGPFVELSGQGKYSQLAKMGDSVDLAEKICVILEDEEKARAQAERAYEHVQAWTVERIVPQLVEAWMS